jgi:large subunit ribosomal protein L15
MDIKLLKTVNNKTKRLGRGYGSGKGGHTSGRGQKGQKSRGKIGILFEGIKVKKSLLKKLPLQRGKGKFKSREKPLIVKISLLNLLPQGSEVDLALLVKHGIVSEEAKILGVKILGGGELSKKLTIAVPISNSAAKKIEKAGGKIK